VTSIPERDLFFDFDASWDHVEKWDDSKAHREGIHKGVSNIDALDIIAFSKERRECLLLEVKDFRDQNENQRQQDRPRKRKGKRKAAAPPPPTENQASDKLTEQVAQKVAGTLAGLVGAARMRDEAFAADLANALSAHRREGFKVRVVLWVEGEPTSQGQSPRSKVNLSALTHGLKRKVAWLTGHPVQVLSTASPTTVPGLTVIDKRP
jgi:hypothetical protein